MKSNYTYGSISESRINTLHHDLERLLYEAIKIMDISVICGYRDEIDQNIFFAKGLSLAQYPNSKHNSYPSTAVDIVPFPTQYSSKPHAYILAGIMMGLALKMGIKLRWGGDWDGDFDMEEHRLRDIWHFELIL